jgi:hypothetical protein
MCPARFSVDEVVRLTLDLSARSQDAGYRGVGKAVSNAFKDTAPR